MHSVARDEAVGKMRRVRECRVISGENDVAQNRELGVDVDRTVHGGDDGNLNVEKIRINRRLASP